MAKQNSYQRTNGLILGGHEAMAKIYKPRVVLVRDVMALSYHVLAQTFGMVGKAQLDGIRHALIEDITHWPGPMASWRESAARLRGEAEHGNLM
jgi:hypothetical protein